MLNSHHTSPFLNVLQGMTFYLALYHGNIFLEYKNASRNAKTVLFTRTQTLNDGLYHRIRVVLTRPL